MTVRDIEVDVAGLIGSTSEDFVLTRHYYIIVSDGHSVLAFNEHCEEDEVRGEDCIDGDVPLLKET